MHHRQLVMCVYITSIWEVCAVAVGADKCGYRSRTCHVTADVETDLKTDSSPRRTQRNRTSPRARPGRPIAGDLAVALGARLPPADPAPAAWNGAYAVPTRIRAGNTPARAGQRHESRHRPTRWKPRPVPQCRSRAAERAANSARRLHVIARSPRVDMRRSKDSYSSLYVRPRGARWIRCGGNRP